jgi:hypothetical protein
MKMLEDPNNIGRDLWDGGRTLSGGVEISFVIGGLDPNKPLALSFRVAPAQEAGFEVKVGETNVGTVELTPVDSWREPHITVPSAHVRSSIRVSVRATKNAFALYHVWAQQKP